MSLSKSLSVLAGWVLLAGPACASPIAPTVVYDQNGYVTGVNNLFIDGSYVNADILGDDVTYQQAFTDTNRKPLYQGKIGVALAAGGALTDALNSGPITPASIASSAGNGILVTKLVIPDLYFPFANKFLGYGWYLVYSASTGQWHSISTTDPQLTLHTVFRTERPVQGTSLVVFSPGDPDGQPQPVPEPATPALLGIGLLMMLRRLRGCASRQPAGR